MATPGPVTGLPVGLQRNAQRAAITPVAWHAHDEIDLEDWIRQGRRLGSIGRGAAWWIGDWVNFGNAKFGEKYSRAAQITGYDIQSLMNMAYVAARFDVSRRREDLSWSHHADLAALSVECQDQWLEVAAGNRLSVRGLRDELRSWRARQKSGDGNGDGDEPPALQAAWPAPVCPRCGYELEEREQEATSAAD